MDLVNPSCTKGVPFSNTKLRIPHGFLNLVDGLAREILRDKPTDIFEFSAIYFDHLLKIREETGFDPTEVGAKLIDELANAGRSCRLRTTCEQQAAIKIQAKYRQYRARLQLLEMRRQRAAIRIQAMYRGYTTRKEGYAEIIKERVKKDYQKTKALERDACADVLGEDFPSAPTGPDPGDCSGAKFDKDKDVAECMAKYDDPVGEWRDEEKGMDGFDPCKAYGPDGQIIEGWDKKSRKARMAMERPGEYSVPDCPDTYGIPPELLSQADKDCQAKLAHYRKVCRDDYDDDYYDDLDSSSDFSDDDEVGGPGMPCKDKTNWPCEDAGKVPHYLKGPCVEYGPCQARPTPGYGMEAATGSDTVAAMPTRDPGQSIHGYDLQESEKDLMTALDLNSEAVKNAIDRIGAGVKGALTRGSIAGQIRRESIDNDDDDLSPEAREIRKDIRQFIRDTFSP